MHVVTSFVTPPAINSTLYPYPPETVPQTPELLNLTKELKKWKASMLERVKKSTDDMAAIDQAMRRMKEREKAKAKALEMRQREHSVASTATTDIDDVRGRNDHNPPGSAASTSSRHHTGSRRNGTDEGKIKKNPNNKRRRDDSPEDTKPPRPLKISPPPPPASIPTIKAPKPVPSSSHAKTSAGPDFTVPPPYQLLPQRPQVPPRPTPMPLHPSEVTEDFSKAKQPAQTLATTFYTSVEPWLRPISEEDVGFLEYTADEVEPFIMPKLGPHYTETWDEEDFRLYGGPLPGFTPLGRPADYVAPVPKWDPSTLADPDLATEDKGHGPLTERLISALLPLPTDAVQWKGVKAAEEAMEGRPGGFAAAAARREKMNVVDLEERIRDTMRFHGLLKQPPDYTEKVDDPIATALRHAQDDLRQVLAVNKARKARLAAIARDRLGYQEYLDLRDNLDRNITALYAKLQKKDQPKPNKKRKKENSSSSGARAGSEPPALPAPTAAALGLNPDEYHRLNVPEQLNLLVETRRKWVDHIGGQMAEIQAEQPGRVWGLSAKSIYEGIEEEVKKELLGLSQENKDGQVPSSSMVKGKGKATVTEGDMDLG